ncbi:MAG: aminopeptidase P N-terminal domain-containing protein [Puniceicoccales bacterium]
MRYDPVDPQFFVRNRERLATLLGPRSLAAIRANDVYPLNADAATRFHQNANLYYLCGIDQAETALIIFPEAFEAKDRVILFVQQTTEHLKIWEGEKLTLDQAAELSGIETVRHISEFDVTLQRLAMEARTLVLETNEHARADASSPTRNERFVRECLERFPLHHYERLAPLLAQLRARKQPEEIAMMREAIAITRAGFERVLKFIKPGVGEWEVEAEFAHEFIRHRSRGFAYQPIVASGENALGLHYVENESLCEDGELVLMDIGAEWGYWNADLTRTVPVNGKFTERQRAVYDAVLRVFHFAAKALRPGVQLKAYTAEVYDEMAKELAGLGLLCDAELKERTPEQDPVRKYFMHGVSHPLGLDVHDVYPPHAEVEAGMVFTIEPGISLAEEGIGIRIENDFLVGEDGNIDLCEGVPLEADEIEAVMRS